MADDVAGAVGDGILSYSEAHRRAAAWTPEGAPEGTYTVRTACEQYVAGLRAGKGETAAHDALGRIRNHILREDEKGRPLPGKHGMGERAVASLTVTELRQWRDALVVGEGAMMKASANRCVTVLKASLNRAYSDEQNGITTDSAWRRLELFTDVHNPRQEHFSEAEVLRLVNAARKQDPCFAELIEAAFLTGARYGELCVLDVRHLNAAGRTLAIPSGKTGSRPVTLTAEAARFFAALAKGRAAAAPLLQTAEGGRWMANMQVRRFKDAAVAAKLPAAAVFYTLRHSHVSRAIENGAPLTLIAENCGTSVLMLEKSYAHMLASKRRDLIEATGPRLRLVASRSP